MAALLALLRHPSFSSRCVAMGDWRHPVSRAERQAKWRHEFSQSLHQSSTQLGTIISTPSIEVADVISGSGFDWVFVDAEYGSISIDSLVGVLAVVQSKVPALVRIPDHQDTSIKRALDAGADGIIVPQVGSARDAGRIVASAKYPPMGVRSVGIGRAHNYGTQFAEYIASANGTTAVVVQIEHIDAVENIEEIISVPGIDGVFIGPYDLSGSLGCVGQVNDHRVQEAIQHTVAICRAAGLPVGVFAGSVQAAKPYVDDKFDFVAVGLDMMLLSLAAKEILEQLRVTDV